MDLLIAYCQEVDETVTVNRFQFVKQYQTNNTARYNVMYGTLKIGEFGIHVPKDYTGSICIYADNIAANILSFPHQFSSTENTWDAVKRVVEYYEKFVKIIVDPILAVHEN